MHRARVGGRDRERVPTWPERWSIRPTIDAQKRMLHQLASRLASGTRGMTKTNNTAKSKGSTSLSSTVVLQG